MPKFYCDYCLVFLSHSSPGGRKQHCKGKKHIQKKIQYYQQFLYEFSNKNLQQRQAVFLPKFNNLGGGGVGLGGGVGGGLCMGLGGGVGSLGFPGGADFQQIPLQHPPPLPSISQGGAIKPAQAMPLPTMNNSELNLVSVENNEQAMIK